ncbi:Pentatricopeptide repeat-containing protein, chloroplastic [Auxenochlorella protothecoides]|uniref:Pentatricopeptide repeat-containing protein, chloroplastic n=1 Tax=Auxenochlorella protothecoides TaxID=3075 RepID=A0A087SQP1_AUXPR|nr:Pentatricopeptide repeat-containing protein, chloroplastic [Auxenochlorella protothecoides]KFM28045.1 Pentatricopeptide repeat-containing protein, chloroplastic [Auxenochlorella protothecoides]
MKSQRACWPAALGRTGSKEVQEEEEVTPSRPSRRFSGWWGSDAESGSKPDAASKLAPRTVSLLSQGLDLLSLRMASSALPTDEQAAEEAAPPPKVSHERKRSWSITGTLGLGRKSITSTKKGEASRMSRAGGEVTVDELVRAVKRLGPKQGVMEGVEAGLACLDSRAVAALLKELAKAGAGHRATELFDALRALPPGAPLARLADLYTYTTAVSQCGAGQQLRRALELVAEMRARRVACNIHTYSALMGVCVKCGECDLALDVYRQALDEGLAPNAVTFNILVYARMLAAGAAPSSTTYTSLISAYGKAGREVVALAAARGMAAHGLEPNVITFSSLVCAAEKARRGDLALAVVADMRARGCRPNVVTYNALLGACCQANMWQAALDAFTQMRSEGCWPDARARLRAALRGDVAAISPLRVLQLYFERLGCSVQAVAADPQLHAMTVMAVEAAAAAAMAPEGPPALAPSLVAAACLAHARGRLGMTPVWPEALQAMTVYAAEDLIPAAQAVEAATAAAATQCLA